MPSSAKQGAPVRVALIILVSVVGLFALALLTGGGTLLWADQTQRDSAGYFKGPAHRVATDSYAVTHDGVTVNHLPGWIGDGKVAHIRIATTGDGGRPLFVGIARQRDADTYLANVAHSNLRDFGVATAEQRYDSVGGTTRPSSPASQPIWVASATGSDSAALTWAVRDGNWSVVVMNADGSKGVAADVKVAAKVGYLGWISAGLLAFGAALLAAAVLLVLGPFRSGGGGEPQTAPAQAVAAS